MLTLFEDLSTNQKIAVGNVHFVSSPTLDYMKFAQAEYLLDISSKYLR